jgi:predicted sugar kinase
MTLQEIMQQVAQLTLEERKELAKMVVDSLVPSTTEDTQPKKKHSILELAGLGAEIWEGVDAQEYINELRSEWDERDNRENL